MERRQFLGKAIAGTTMLGLTGLPLASCKSIGRKHITILHTNDVHSHIDPFPADHSAFAKLGGVAKRAALIEEIRKENPNTLLFDAGDIFQGTPYFNFYGGELEFRLMSKMRYDAATIGNHDFDNGIEGLLAQLPYASFQMISANYNFQNTVLDGFVTPYKVYNLDGIRVGVFGLGIKLEGLVTPDLYKETKYLDPLEVGLDMARILKEEEQCDLVVALSHLGYEYKNPQRASDMKLARETENIDLIIGGHTHTFLEKPVVRLNRKENKVLINQVGCYGINLGRIDFWFEKKKEKQGKGVSIEV